MHAAAAPTNSSRLQGGYTFFMPPVSLMGPGALKGAGQYISKMGLKKALVVTDEVLHKTGATRYVTGMLESIGVQYEVFDGVQPNPTVQQVEQGLQTWRASGCDFIVSFGGGEGRCSLLEGGRPGSCPRA